jgi:hypothetical protein
LWVHGGKTYFLSRTAAFEPKTGKVLWTLGDQKSRQDITVACEDYAVTQGGEQLRCYRITPEKAEQIWVLPWKGSTYMDGPVIHRDHLYAIGHFTDGRDQKKSSDGKPVGCLWCIQLPTGTVVGVQVGSDSPEMLAAEGLILDQHYKSAWRAAPGAFELLSKPSGGHQQDQRFLCPAAGWAPAAIADGRYFARLDMYCMGLACWDLRDRGVPATPAAGTR